VFFASPGRPLKVSGHGEAARRYQVQIDGCEVSCHDEIVLVASKKQGTSASADSANYAVPVDETVRVLLYFVNCIEFKGVEFGIDYKYVLALAKALN
jgi:microcompartment protein CcmK/EutM